MPVHELTEEGVRKAMMSGTIGAGGVWKNYKPQGTGVGLERAKEIKDYHKPRPDAREAVKMSKMDGAELAAVSKKRMAKEHIQRFVETMSKPDITHDQWQKGVNNIWGVLKDNPTIKPEDITWPKAPPKPPAPPKVERKPIDLSAYKTKPGHEYRPPPTAEDIAKAKLKDIKKNAKSKLHRG